MAEAIQNSYSGSLGKVSTGLINKIVSSKMPGGFGMTQIKAFLGSSYGLGPKRSDALLMHGLTMEPASRLANEAEAKAWLDQVAKAYAAKVGISFAQAGSGTAGVVMNSEEFDKFKAKLDKLVLSQIQDCARFLGVDLSDDSKKVALAQEKQVSSRPSGFVDE